MNGPVNGTKQGLSDIFPFGVEIAFSDECLQIAGLAGNGLDG